MSNELNDKIEKLPKWAKDLIVSKTRQIERLESKITDLTCDKVKSNVWTGSEFSGKTYFPHNSVVTFQLKDTVLKRGESLVSYCNEIAVRVVDDIETGGDALEINYSGDASFIIVPKVSNEILLRSAHAGRRGFVGFEAPM